MMKKQEKTSRWDAETSGLTVNSQTNCYNTVSQHGDKQKTRQRQRHDSNPDRTHVDQDQGLNTKYREWEGFYLHAGISDGPTRSSQVKTTPCLLRCCHYSLVTVMEA